MKGLIRGPKDFWTGAMYVAVGVAAIVIGREYPMGAAEKMGPGYFPSVLGALLAIIGAAAVIRSFRKSAEAIAPFAWKQLVLILGALVLFGVLVRGAGLAVALVVLVMMSAYASARFRWLPAIALAIGMTAFSVLVFVLGLKLPLPIIGPWLGG